MLGALSLLLGWGRFDVAAAQRVTLVVVTPFLAMAWNALRHKTLAELCWVHRAPDVALPFHALSEGASRVTVASVADLCLERMIMDTLLCCPSAVPGALLCRGAQPLCVFRKREGRL